MRVRVGVQVAALAAVAASLSMAAAPTRDLSGSYVATGSPALGGHGCLPRLEPGVSTDALTHIVVGRRAVVMLQPDYHRLRRVYLDVPHPDEPAISALGDSIGWWEGDTLVIETIAVKSGQTLVERLRPVAGRGQLEITSGGRVQLADLLPGQRWIDDGCVGAVKAVLPTVTVHAPVPPGRARAPAPGNAPAALDLEGTWQIEAPVTALLTSRAQPPPLNAASRKLYEERQAMLAAGNAIDFDEALRCQPLGPFRAETAGPPIDIIQGGSALFIGASGNRMGRIVYMQRTLERASRRSYAGQWAGHWDGEVLVLEGSGFNARTLLDAAGMPHSTALHVVQRIKLLEQGQRLEVRTAYGDPGTFTQAWQSLYFFRRLPNAHVAGAQSSPCYNVP